MGRQAKRGSASVSHLLLVFEWVMHSSHSPAFHAMTDVHVQDTRIDVAANR